MILVQQRITSQAGEVSVGDYARDVFEVGWAVVRGCGYVARYNTFGEEGMVDDLVESGSVFRFSGENVLHKLLSIRRYLAVSREFVIIVTNTSGTQSAVHYTKIFQMGGLTCRWS